MSQVPTTATSELAWPILDVMPEELRHMEALDETAEDPKTVPQQQSAPRTTEEYWSLFESQIDDFAVAKTVVDFLEKSPEDLKLHQGLYLQACITLKRGAIAYNQAKEAAEQAKKTSEATDKALRLEMERMRDPYYKLEVTVKKVGSYLAKPHVLGTCLALAIVWIIKH
ncbi:hypothetical protein [Aquabacterium sp. NJ1]|uniref:hypothetical protein n=1 Tax=Aquabacterium sp. NJ1 TaxID=1538295 RepID=UPI00126A18B2|nr:hypothetical protein [Aquabacterium sp. NJ1]